MGYTHSLRRPKTLDATRFTLWQSDVRRLLAALPATTDTAGGYYRDVPLRICGPWGLGGPIITPDGVYFNGDAQQDCDGETADHETFYVKRVYQPEAWEKPEGKQRWYFTFCKTARKPYDVLVTAALIRLAYHFPEACKIESDGDADEWAAGAALCQQVFGVAVLPLEIERSHAA